MVKLNQRRNLFASFAIIFLTAIALYVIETNEVFRIKTPEIHNEVALAAFESCKQLGSDCQCEVLRKCEVCPSEGALPRECQSTGRREYVRCSPGDHEFFKQCVSTEYEASNAFWAFYLSSGVLLVGSVVVVNHRKSFLEHCSALRMENI
ncbi:hypothetical protein ACHWQZ_G010373 [Mnemiopsis leidyi]